MWIGAYCLLSSTARPATAVSPSATSIACAWLARSIATNILAKLSINREFASSRPPSAATWERSEEHTSELHSQSNLVCRLLLEKKNIYQHHIKNYLTTIHLRNAQVQTIHLNLHIHRLT